jgi:hypothetical protein
MLSGAQCSWAMCRSGPRQWDFSCCDPELFFLTPTDWRDGMQEFLATARRLDESIQLL